MTGRGISCKVVFLGDTSVGKSCLAVRFVRNDFFEFQEPTIGAAFLSKTMTHDNKRYKFEIWDTAGQERYRSLAPMYYRGARAAVIVYDITDEDSFKGAKSWIRELKKKTSNCLIILVGNKIDLKEKRKLNAHDVRDYARDNNIIYMESSAKSGENVDQIFTKIAYNLPEQPDDIGIHEPLDITIRDTEKTRYNVYTCC